MSKALAAKQAKKLLTQVGFDIKHYDVHETGGCAIDVEAIARSLGIDVKPADLSDEVSGVFFKKDKQMFIRYNNMQHEHRQRFTIAHEIGHYVLHASENLHYDKKEYYRSDNVSNSDEIAANRFAAELLMPQPLIDKCIDADIAYVSDLAEMFNVSESSMKYRLISLGYIYTDDED